MIYGEVRHPAFDSNASVVETGRLMKEAVLRIAHGLTTNQDTNQDKRLEYLECAWRCIGRAYRLRDRVRSEVQAMKIAGSPDYAKIKRLYKTIPDKMRKPLATATRLAKMALGQVKDENQGSKAALKYARSLPRLRFFGRGTEPFMGPSPSVFSSRWRPAGGARGDTEGTMNEYSDEDEYINEYDYGDEYDSGDYDMGGGD